MNNIKILEPDGKEPRISRKQFYEIAALQSGAGCSNINIPDALLTELVTVLDPCILNNLEFANINWDSLEGRILKRLRGENREESPGSDELIEIDQPILEKETNQDEVLQKEAFFEELIDTIRNIRKYNDPILSTSQSWIDETEIPKISKNLIVLLSFLPSFFTIEDITTALFVENGVAVFCNILINIPELVPAFKSAIMTSFVQGKRNRIRCTVIQELLLLFPAFVGSTIEKLVNSRSDCNFGCRLATEILDDVEFLQFLEPQLSDRDSNISKIVLKSGGRQSLPLITARLLKMADSALEDPLNTTVAKSPYCTILAACLLELMCSTEDFEREELRKIKQFVFRISISPRNLENDTMDVMEVEDEMSGALENSRRQNAEPSPFGEAHETFVLASILAVPFFTESQNVDGSSNIDDCVSRWLDVSRIRTSDTFTTFSANLLFVHSCLMSARLEELSQFASEVVHRKVEILRGVPFFETLKSTFFSKCLTEIEVAERSVRQPATKKLNEKSGGRLPIHIISTLQAAGVYKTFKIPISKWLETQLETVSLPMTEILADLIEGLIPSNETLDPKFIANSFRGETIGNDENLVRRLYMLLYLCGCKEKMVETGINYSTLKIRYLLSLVETRHEEFENIRWRLISRCGHLFPYMMPTTKSMRLAELNGVGDEKNLMDFGKIMSVAQSGCKKKIEHLLEMLNMAPIFVQMAALEVVIEGFMSTLDETRCSDGAIKSLLSIFSRCEQICPSTLFEKCSKRWLASEETLRIEDIYKLPALLFRVDRRILNSPPHFECFLKALSYFSIVIRCEMRMRTIAANSTAPHSAKNEADRKERDHLTGAFIDSQHSVLIHALIEVCDSKRMKDEESGDFAVIEKRQRICRMVYEFLHRAFIDFEGLLKVVLYQKFPIRQIRPLVEGVPSLFAANVMILDMLSLPDPQRRIFAVVLAAEICRKYRIRESLETARIVCDVVHSLHKFGELPSSNKLWKYVAPALIVLATEFPSLTDCICRLLERVLANTKNRLAVRCGIMAVDPRHEEYCLIGTISDFLDRNNR